MFEYKWLKILLLGYACNLFPCQKAVYQFTEAQDSRIFWSRFVPIVTFSYQFSPASSWPRQYVYNADEPLIISDHVYENVLLDYEDKGDGNIKPGMQTEYDGSKHQFFLNFTWHLDDLFFLPNRFKKEEEEEVALQESRKFVGQGEEAGGDFEKTVDREKQKILASLFLSDCRR